MSCVIRKGGGSQISEPLHLTLKMVVPGEGNTQPHGSQA